jgi:hypothetical protein
MLYLDLFVLKQLLLLIWHVKYCLQLNLNDCNIVFWPNLFRFTSCASGNNLSRTTWFTDKNATILHLEWHEVFEQRPCTFYKKITELKTVYYNFCRVAATWQQCLLTWIIFRSTMACIVCCSMRYGYKYGLYGKPYIIPTNKIQALYEEVKRPECKSISKRTNLTVTLLV